MAQRTIGPTNTIQNVLDAGGDDDTVIVDANGTPRAAIVPIERYEHLRDLDLAEKRARALETLDRIEAEYAAQPNKLTPEEVEELADRFSREMVEDLVREGRIRFEEAPAS